MSVLQSSQSILKKTFRVIFLGNSKSGKTCLIQKFVKDQFGDVYNVIQPTIGIDFVSKTIMYKNNNCRFQLWDTSGQERFRELIPAYLKDIDCAIFVFDVEEPESLKGVLNWIEMVKQTRPDNFLMVLCGCKCDLTRKVQKQQIQEIVQKYKMIYHTVSAKTGQNLQQLFFNITQKIIQRFMDKKSKILGRSSIKLQQVQSSQRKLTELQRQIQSSSQQQQKQIKRVDFSKPKKYKFLCCCPY